MSSVMMNRKLQLGEGSWMLSQYSVVGLDFFDRIRKNLIRLDKGGAAESSRPG